MSQAKPSVLLADDHPAILDKLSQLLSLDFEVVGVVGDGAALHEQGGAHRDHANKCFQ